MYNLEKFNFYLNELIANLEIKMFKDPDFKKFLKFYNFKFYTNKYFFIEIYNENINYYLINQINQEDNNFFKNNFKNNILNIIISKINNFWYDFSNEEKKYIWNYLKILNYYSN